MRGRSKQKVVIWRKEKKKKDTAKLVFQEGKKNVAGVGRSWRRSGKRGTLRNGGCWKKNERTQ